MNRKGQSLVEFALILPLILLLLMGIIEFGRIFNAYMVLSHLSREGARYAATGITDTQIHTHIEEGTQVLGQGQVIIIINPGQNNRKRGQAVNVRVSYDIPLIIPVINNILPNPYRISVETTMRME